MAKETSEKVEFVVYNFALNISPLRIHTDNFSELGFVQNKVKVATFHIKGGTCLLQVLIRPAKSWILKGKLEKMGIVKY